MKLTRQITSIINRRAYALSQQSMKRWADELKAAIEEGDITPGEIDTWLPDDLLYMQGDQFDLDAPPRDHVLDATDHLAGF